MDELDLNSKIINDIAFILSKRPDVNLYVDMLIFENDKTKKIELLKKLTQIEEIKNNPELMNVWKKILINYTKKVEN